MFAGSTRFVLSFRQTKTKFDPSEASNGASNARQRGLSMTPRGKAPVRIYPSYIPSRSSHRTHTLLLRARRLPRVLTASWEVTGVLYRGGVIK